MSEVEWAPEDDGQPIRGIVVGLILVTNAALLVAFTIAAAVIFGGVL